MDFRKARTHNSSITTFRPTSPRLWALACRLRQVDLEQLSLKATGRSRASFVSDAAHRAFVRHAWTKMPRRGGTTTAANRGHASKQWSAPGTELASRLTAADVSAAVCFSFGLRLMVLLDWFAVIAMRSSGRGGSSAAIKQTCCRSYR